MVAAVFNLPEELPPLDDGVAQFYGAVGGTLCSTLWDPGSSVNLITPEFAKELSERGVRWEYCEPCHIEHGSGESGGVRSAAPAVRRVVANVILCHQGLTYRGENIVFYVYKGSFPDVVLSRKQLQELKCLEQPASKLLSWDVTRDDVCRLAHLVDSARVQAHCVMEPCVNNTQSSPRCATSVARYGCSA